ncbi:MAG: Mur ligase domain-containing protein, partial [Kiritimatiellota bacterium]|nr:Mur ligase domain-containing protein [Kiritimatiellota bacterium]
MSQLDTQVHQETPGAPAGRKSGEAGGGIALAGKRFHFIGAGGIGMSGLAQLLIKHRAIVAGSDQMPSEVVTGLCRMGADIRIGHADENLDPRTDAVVISAAITQ